MTATVDRKNRGNGLFVVLEGGEGVGKSTNLAFIHQFLQQHNITFQTSREPGGTGIAERIRQLILEKNPEPMAPMTELLLVFAARAQHLEQKILPVLASGEWMVCDRFTDATYAYQGGGRQLDQRVIALLEQLVQGDMRPDCIIVLDAPLAVTRQRTQSRAELDRLESEQESFHQRVRETYLARAAADPGRYAVIDAAQPLGQVQKDIAAVLEKLIKGWQNT